MTFRPPIVLLAGLLALAGCAEMARGTLITGDGRVLANTAQNWRDEKARTLATQLSQRLAPRWRAEVAIAELPTWEDDDLVAGRGWRLPRATVAIALIGDGPLAETPEAISAAAVDFLRTSVDRGARNIRVEVVSRAQPAIASAPAAPAAAPTLEPGAGQAAQATAPRAAGPSTSKSWPQRYVVQAADTLAEISAVFYGDVRHWRRIVDANPGLDPAALPIGQPLLIPAPPEPGR